MTDPTDMTNHSPTRPNNEGSEPGGSVAVAIVASRAPGADFARKPIILPC